MTLALILLAWWTPPALLIGYKLYRVGEITVEDIVFGLLSILVFGWLTVIAVGVHAVTERWDDVVFSWKKDGER